MELTGDVNPSMEALNRADILIVTPEVTEPTAAVVGSSLTTFLSIHSCHTHQSTMTLEMGQYQSWLAEATVRTAGTASGDR